MKQLLLIFCILGIGKISLAQTNAFPLSGSAGIGTTSPNFAGWSSALTIKGASNAGLELVSQTAITDGANIGALRFVAGTTDVAQVAADVIGGVQNSGRLRFTVWNNGTYYNAAVINKNGYLGLGTVSPTSTLTVQGFNANNVMQLKNTDGNPMLSVNTALGVPYQDIYKADGITLGIHLSGDGTTYFNNGNIGVGTTFATEKLSVNGKIRAHEVKVETANWPDYVFGKSYELRPLLEVARFIEANQHLPEIPSALEIEKDGQNLGEMNSKLLLKIEEFTLYLIQLNREIALLKTQMQDQQKELYKLKSGYKANFSSVERH